MKKQMVFLSLATLFAFGVQATATGYAELYKVKCSAHENVNDNPAFTVEFKSTSDGEDFIGVKVQERMSSRVWKDDYWVTIHDESEQIMVSNKEYSIGVDDIVVVVDKKGLLAGNKKANGSVTFRVGAKDLTYDLYCK